MPIKKVIKSLETLPLRTICRIPGTKKYAYQYVLQQVMEYESHEGLFCSLYRRPKYAEQIVSVEKETDAQKCTAIIMQGPLIAKDDFTVETVKIYEKLYPGTTVIVSTWEGEDPKIIEQLRQLRGCEVLVNKQPEYSGVLNLNYQVESTMAGLKRAKELGKEYTFKTRCDFRFVRIGLINYFVALCKAFPIDVAVPYQKQRIICDGGVTIVYFVRIGWATALRLGEQRICCVTGIMS